MAIVSADDLVIEREVVSFDNGGQKTDLLVNGLGLPHILLLIQRHGPYLRDRYTELTERVASEDGDLDVQRIILGLMVDSAPLAMDIIACAIGAPKRADVAASLPLAVQMQILILTARLTLESEGGVGKLVEGINGLASMLDLNLTSYLKP